MMGVTLVGLFAGGAEAAERVVVLDVVQTGVPYEARPKFETSLADGLRASGFEVVVHARVSEAALRGEVAEGCTFGPCVARVGAAESLSTLCSGGSYPRCPARRG